MQHMNLPLHSLERGSKQIHILSLDYSNPYDYKREHRHTYYEVMLIARGGGNQLIDFKNYSAYDFSCYIICPQQIHLMNRNDSAGTILQFSDEMIQAPELLVALKQLPFYENAAIVFENDAHAFTELKALLNLLEGQARKSDLPGRLAVSHLLHAFVALMLSYHQNKESADLAADRKLLLDFFELLEINYKANRSVQYFINALGSTEKKLGAVTKKHTGFSPLQVIHNRILLEAKRLLLFEKDSHKEIAYELGFDSPASFSAFIKSKTGYAPSELSKQLTEIHM